MEGGKVTQPTLKCKDATTTTSSIHRKVTSASGHQRNDCTDGEMTFRSYGLNRNRAAGASREGRKGREGRGDPACSGARGKTLFGERAPPFSLNSEVQSAKHAKYANGEGLARRERGQKAPTTQSSFCSFFSRPLACLADLTSALGFSKRIPLRPLRPWREALRIPTASFRLKQTLQRSDWDIILSSLRSTQPR